MHLHFHGAVGNTTGSRHILSFKERRILLDCGLFQGRRETSQDLNLNFPFDPESLDLLLLSHAHIDHCGNIPNLVNRGFRGPIYCTTATHDLAVALLRDSAHIQEKDVEYVNKKRLRQNLPPVKPLYTMQQAEESLTYFNGMYYNRPRRILDGVTVTFQDAGHILGSALTVIDLDDNGHRQRILFTGDLGRHNMPVLRDPEVPSGINFMIIESTYGNRIHGDLSQTEQKLERVIKKAVDRGGKIIVPSFSVGRTQEFVYTLKRLMDAGRVPCIPVFVDSPLSANVTEIFRQHYECYDSQTRDLFLRGEDPFGFSCLEYVRNVERSKKLNTMKGPAIIISASGMCEAGRILHHLKNNIENEANIVLIVGFMAENTLGRNLVERKPEVRIFGESFRLNAEVVIMNEFSAHADAQDLENFTRAVASAGDLRRVFIVHGEPSQSEALAGRLEPVIPGGVILPEEGREYPLSS